MVTVRSRSGPSYNDSPTHETRLHIASVMQHTHAHIHTYHTHVHTDDNASFFVLIHLMFYTHASTRSFSRTNEKRKLAERKRQ